MLETRGLTAFYGDFQALYGIDASLAPGETVAIIGANGAGKSTLLRAVMGQVPIGHGTITYKGDDLAPLATHARVARGLALVPEGRRLFPSLSVSENLRIGAHVGRPGRWTVARVVELFPLLARLLSRPADVLLLDEVSLGLAPIVVRDLYAAIPGIKSAGTTVVIVEQDVSLALEIADHVYCMLEGRVSLSGTPAALSHAAVTDAYFGVRA